MKRISKIVYLLVIAFLFVMSSCRSTHGADGLCPGHGGYSSTIVVDNNNL